MFISATESGSPALRLYVVGGLWLGFWTIVPVRGCACPAQGMWWVIRRPCGETSACGVKLRPSCAALRSFLSEVFQRRLRHRRFKGWRVRCSCGRGSGCWRCPGNSVQRRRGAAGGRRRRGGSKRHQGGSVPPRRRGGADERRTSDRKQQAAGRPGRENTVRPPQSSLLGRRCCLAQHAAGERHVPYQTTTAVHRSPLLQLVLRRRSSGPPLPTGTNWY